MADVNVTVLLLHADFYHITLGLCDLLRRVRPLAVHVVPQVVRADMLCSNLVVPAVRWICRYSKDLNRFQRQDGLTLQQCADACAATETCAVPTV